MKKVFMSLAMMALTTTAMAAGFNTYVQNSNAVEAVNDDDVPIDKQKEISSNVYTIKVPEGWTARSRMVSNTCVMGLNDSPYTTASFGAVSYQSLAEYKTSREDDGYTSLENVTVNDREFIVMEMEDSDGHFYLTAATAWGDGSFHVKLQTGNCMMEQDEKKAAIDENLKTILENLTFNF